MILSQQNVICNSSDIQGCIRSGCAHGIEHDQMGGCSRGYCPDIGEYVQCFREVNQQSKSVTSEIRKIRCINGKKI